MCSSVKSDRQEREKSEKERRVSTAATCPDLLSCIKHGILTSTSQCLLRGSSVGCRLREALEQEHKLEGGVVEDEDDDEEITLITLITLIYEEEDEDEDDDDEDIRLR